MGCDKNCCSMIEDLLEQIQEGLGRVDYDRIDEYIEEKIGELQEEIISGEISAHVDVEALLAQIKEALSNDFGLIDAYNVDYKNTTVGKKLDELSKKLIAFEGKISVSRKQFEKGEVHYNFPVYLTFNKPLKSLKVNLYVNDMNTSTLNVEPTATSIEIPRLAETTQIVVKAVSTENEELVLDETLDFRLKYYVGCSGADKVQNKEILSLNSYYAYDNETEYSHIFHPIGKQYLWWAFPVNLHTDYDFFNNGFMDSNYVWITGNLTNDYGYTSEYLFVRSGNTHTSSNIYTEVKAHEHK